MLQAILTVILLCPAPPAPDLSTPESAARAVATIYLPRFYEDSKLATQVDENDLLGREHYSTSGWEQIQRVVSEAKRTRDRSKTLRWSFRLGKVTRSGRGAEARVWVTQRRNRYDYTTKKIRVVEKRIEHRFSMERIGAKWLVTGAKTTCYGCSGSAECALCRGSGKLLGKACKECKGGGVCGTCAGKKLRAEDLGASFKAGVLSTTPGPYAVGDQSTPKAALEGYLRLRSRKQVVLGAIRNAHFQKTLDAWRPFFSPTLVKTFEQNLARSRAEIAPRQEEWDRIARAGPVSIGSDPRKAYGMVHYVLPPSRGRKGTTIKFRLALRQQGQRWLIEQVQTKCYSCKRTRICKYCSGSGKDRQGRAACVSCAGTAACNPCQGIGWIESTLIP